MIVNTRLTKNFMAIFALAKRLPTSATLVKVIIAIVKVYMATTLRNMKAMPNNLDPNLDVTKHLATLSPILPSRTLPSTTHTFAI